MLTQKCQTGSSLYGRVHLLPTLPPSIRRQDHLEGLSVMCTLLHPLLFYYSLDFILSFPTPNPTKHLRLQLSSQIARYRALYWQTDPVITLHYYNSSPNNFILQSLPLFKKDQVCDISGEINVNLTCLD